MPKEFKAMDAGLEGGVIPKRQLGKGIGLSAPLAVLTGLVNKSAIIMARKAARFPYLVIKENLSRLDFL